MVSHHPAQFGGDRYCGSKDMMYLVFEGQYCTCSRFSPPLLFISKVHGLKAHSILY